MNCIHFLTFLCQRNFTHTCVLAAKSNADEAIKIEMFIFLRLLFGCFSFAATYLYKLLAEQLIKLANYRYIFLCSFHCKQFIVHKPKRTFIISFFSFFFSIHEELCSHYKWMKNYANNSKSPIWITTQKRRTAFFWQLPILNETKSTLTKSKKKTKQFFNSLYKLWTRHVILHFQAWNRYYTISRLHWEIYWKLG